MSPRHVLRESDPLPLDSNLEQILRFIEEKYPQYVGKRIEFHLPVKMESHVSLDVWTYFQKLFSESVKTQPLPTFTKLGQLDNCIGEEKFPVIVKVFERTPLSSSLSSPTSFVSSASATLSLLNFWDALKVAEEKNDIITLPENVYILGDSDIGSSLFVRPCFPKFLEMYLNVIKNPKIRHVIVLGNPGIGKTYFGYYLLYHFAKRGATVVYQQGKWNRFLFSENGMIQKGTVKDFKEYLDDRSAFYIVDSREPDRVQARTILITSPRKDVWYQFSKGLCAIRYMPVWSNEEILKCRATLFPHLEESLVQELFYKWGGIPRFVLEKATEKSNQKLLENAVASVNLDLIFDVVGQLDAPDNVSHRLIHIKVKDFENDGIQFASEYVADRIYEKLLLKERNRLLQFIIASNDVGEFGTLRGFLFERYAHSVISKGGTFKVRELNNEDVVETEFEEVIDMEETDNEEEELFYMEDTENEGEVTSSDEENELEESSNEGDEQLSGVETSVTIPSCSIPVSEKPRAMNFESVDFFVPQLAYMFQMTGSSRQPSKIVGLKKAISSMILTKEVVPHLYFVVPEDRFSTFSYQNYCNSKGKKLERISAAIQRVKQFVLAIPNYSA